MYMRKLVFLVIFAFMLTGCTRVTDNFDEIVNATMSKEKTSVNTVSTGYELYIPTGVMQVSDNEYNQKFRIKDRNVYLYVDTISYYYRNILNYKEENDYNYYYKKLEFKDKVGYIGINKNSDDEFFCEIVYNYSKIEFYSDLYNLPIILANSLIIQNSIKYDDSLIRLELDSMVNDGREVKFELDKPKESESTFDKYLQEYVVNETADVVLPDED